MSEFAVAAHCHDLLGESPLWCERTSTLWWIDIQGAALHNLNPKTGAVRTIVTGGGRLGSIALRDNGGLLLATAEGLFFFDPSTGSQELFKSSEALRPNHFFNEGRCDRQGRFWVATRHAAFEPEGVLYRLDLDGTLSECLGGIIVPNSMAFSPDGTTMYFADSRRLIISAFDFEPNAGAISNRRTIVDRTGRPGRPDGSCVDVDGYLWNADYAGGQIIRYRPDGAIDRVVTTPVSHPTSLCFGGPKLDTLYVTTSSHLLNPQDAARQQLAGAVLSFRPGVLGLPEARFRG